jgi:hypothetical protein
MDSLLVCLVADGSELSNWQTLPYGGITRVRL